MKLFGPGLFFLGTSLIAVSISLLVTVYSDFLFRLNIVWGECVSLGTKPFLLFAIQFVVHNCSYSLL